MKRGQITVFLSLILCLILSVLFAGIESVRVAGMRLKLESAMDMGLYSVFAEYNRELLNQYDLYFIDTSYGSGISGPFNAAEHLRDYMNHNLRVQNDPAVFGAADFTGLMAERADVIEFSLATDYQGDSFKKQAVHYMKDVYGISIINKLRKHIHNYQSCGVEGRNIDNERKRSEERLYERKASSEDANEGRAIDIENPADDVNHSRSGFFELVMQEGMTVSDKKFSVSDLASHRELQEGNSVLYDGETLNSPLNEMLFGKYIEKKYSSYTKPFHHEALEYEIEYILCGKNSDSENLKLVVNKLIRIREASNVIFLFRDGEKQAEAEALAAVIAAACGAPLLTEFIKYTLLFSWAFVESIVDIRVLLSGGKVPLLKMKGDWNFAIEHIGNFREHLGNGKSSENGLSYEDYLQIFLYFQNGVQKVYRCMDVIELNLRKTAGNRQFIMDGCLDFMEAEVNVTSRFGYAFKIKRSYGYEKR